MKNHTGNLIMSIVSRERITKPLVQVAALRLKRPRVRPWRQRVVIFTLILSDIFFASLFWGVAILFQSIWGQGPLAADVTVTYILANTGAWLALRALLGLYPGYGLSPPEELRRQTYAAIAALAIALVFVFGLQTGDVLSRLLIGVNFIERLFLAPLTRYLVKRGLAKAGLWGKPAVILGAGHTGRQLMRTLKREWGLGLRPVSVFDFPLYPQGGVFEGGTSEVGNVANALHQVRKQGIDTVIFAMPQVRKEDLSRFVGVARRRMKHVILVPNLSGITTSAVTARDLAGTLGVEIKENLLNPWPLRGKRVLDLVTTVTGGTLLLPLLLVISLIIWMDSPGPALYRAQRMGKDGELFSCIKFRTMVPEAEAKLQGILEESFKLKEEYLMYHKLRYDPRVTRIGRLLRKTSLDELPQMWNVLRGEMSLVGPRPYLPRESEKIGAAQEEVLRVPPGITGPWQVAGRSHASFDERVQMDVYYVRDWSLWLDLILLARTLEVLVFRRAAY